MQLLRRWIRAVNELHDEVDQAVLIQSHDPDTAGLTGPGSESGPGSGSSPGPAVGGITADMLET